MFVIKQNDTAPSLRAILKDAAGVVVPVTGASVRFHMRDTESETVKVDAAANVIDGAAGVVEYSWIASDTDTVGSFAGEFEVTYANSKIETFPNGGYIKIKIVDDIA